MSHTAQKIIRKMALVTIKVSFLYIVIDSQNSINVALSLRYFFQEVTMLWRTVRSMDVMMHSSSFLLPKLHRPANRPLKNYALVVLNQHLPRFMPRLWDHGNSSSFLFLFYTLLEKYLKKFTFEFDVIQQT